MEDLDLEIQKLTDKLNQSKKLKIEKLKAEIALLEGKAPEHEPVKGSKPIEVKKEKTKSAVKQRPALTLTSKNYNVSGYRRESKDKTVRYGISVIDTTGKCNPRRMLVENKKLKEIVENYWQKDGKKAFSLVTNRDGISSYETNEVIVNCDITADNSGGIGKVSNISRFSLSKALGLQTVGETISTAKPAMPVVIVRPATVKPESKKDQLQKADQVLADKLGSLRSSIKRFSIPKNHPKLVDDKHLKAKGYDCSRKFCLITREDNMIGRLVEVALGMQNVQDLVWENKGREQTKNFDFSYKDVFIDVKGTFDPTDGRSNDVFDRGIMIEYYKINQMTDVMMLFSCYEDDKNLYFNCRGWISKDSMKDYIEQAEAGNDRREEFVWIVNSGIKYKIKVNALNPL